MEFVFDRLFNNAFFQLPFLEAMTYVGAFLVIAAGVIKSVGPCSRRHP
jgi:hypothetical protein